jgi:prepilin-type N-terminal cleavage/methylation domain-containing protein
MIRNRSRRSGVTLIELIVTIVIIGVVLAITSLSLAGEKHKDVTTASIHTRIKALRSSAIHLGSSQTATLSDSAGVILVTALPDGRVISGPPNVGRTAGVAGIIHAR